ncbi:hypothetical protein Hanom_Chr14g01328401 [Helianthus anomalus]
MLWSGHNGVPALMTCTFNNNSLDRWAKKSYVTPFNKFDYFVINKNIQQKLTAFS